MTASNDWVGLKEYFKTASQERRAGNRESSPKLLEQAGVEFQSCNNGAHVIVTGAGWELIDFWPGTGKWIARETKHKGRGVFNLLKYVKGEQE